MENKATPFDPAAALLSAQLDPLAPVELPPDVLTIDGVTVCRLGSFTTIIGRAKARKGFFAGGLAAAAVVGSCSIDGIRGNFANGKTQVLYFDTEQGQYWGTVAYRRICKAIGNDNPTNLKYYNLQPYTPAERLKIIDTAIEQTDNLLLVVIDGIRDLISSINDEAEATAMTSTLLRWCALKQIHVLNILHQNKNDLHARGWLGSEITNKSEGVFSVSKERDTTISTVKCEYSRGREFQPFSFTIDPDSGLPVRCDFLKTEQPTRQEERIERYQTIFTNRRKLPYADLIRAYMEISSFKESAAKKHTSEALTNGILQKDDNGDYRISPEYNNLKSDDDDIPF